MKYDVTLDGEKVVVELHERDGKTFVVQDGAEIPVEMTAVREGVSYSMLLGPRSLRVVASGANDDLLLTLYSETWKASVTDEREALLAATLGEKGGRHHGGVVKSVMPGIVREVRVAKGDTVHKGQALLILEAMKMQNEIRAESDASVVDVHVTAGTAVAKGDKLVTLG
jgi:pyruvate carboxylase subunit B